MAIVGHDVVDASLDAWGAGVREITVAGEDLSHHVIDLNDADLHLPHDELVDALEVLLDDGRAYDVQEISHYDRCYHQRCEEKQGTVHERKPTI
jgi:hypothetical protein